MKNLVVAFFICICSYGQTPPENLRFVTTNAITAGTELYVATDGSDSDTGTLADPFLTLEAARNAIRDLKTAETISTNGATVYLRGGTYYRDSAFDLLSTDAGTANGPIRYKAYPGETVILTGAKLLTNFVSVTDAGILARLQTAVTNYVKVSDLSTLSVSDYGDLTNRGAIMNRQDIRSAWMRPWMVELFFNKARQQLSRWPNQNKSGEVWAWTVAPVPGSFQEDPGDNWFTFREERPKDWALTEDVWVHGMWNFMWADSYEKLVSIADSTNAMTLDRPGDYGIVANTPYEVLNVLEELDLPGEWVIDRSNDLLYFYPPSTAETNQIEVSVLTNNFINLLGADHVYIQGLIFEGSRASGIVTSNASNIKIIGCTFRNLGNLGVIVGNSITNAGMDTLAIDYDFQGGTNNIVYGCHFYGLGEGGISVSGGDRVNLTRANHVIENNYINDYNTNIRCYRPAVRIDGVGMRLSHATIHNSPHMAIQFYGNDHLIEYNEIYDVCKFTSDAGVIYSVARDWKQQGSVLRRNLMHSCRDSAFYLDDFTSGVIVYGNIIYNTHFPIIIGGGRDNVFAQNLVLGFSSVGYSVSGRGTTWSSSSISGLVASLKLVDYNSSPWSLRYTGMPTLSSNLLVYESDTSATNLFELAQAKGNQIFTNIFIRTSPQLYDITSDRVETNGNFSYGTYGLFTGFSNTNAVDARDFSILTNHEAVVAGFIPLDQSLVGVYSDASAAFDADSIEPYPTVVSRGPFHGTALTVPGTIQIEDFDDGPARDAFLEGNPNRFGNNTWEDGLYRPNADFDIWGFFDNTIGGIYYQMDLNPPSWVEYTVNVQTTGDYTFEIFYTTMSGNYKLLVDGVEVTSNMTAGSSTATVSLTSGQRILRLLAVGTNGSPGGRLDYMTFTLIP